MPVSARESKFARWDRARRRQLRAKGWVAELIQQCWSTHELWFDVLPRLHAVLREGRPIPAGTRAELLSVLEAAAELAELAMLLRVDDLEETGPRPRGAKAHVVRHPDEIPIAADYQLSLRLRGRGGHAKAREEVAKVWGVSERKVSTYNTRHPRAGEDEISRPFLESGIRRHIRPSLDAPASAPKDAVSDPVMSARNRLRLRRLISKKLGGNLRLCSSPSAVILPTIPIPRSMPSSWDAPDSAKRGVAWAWVAPFGERPKDATAMQPGRHIATPAHRAPAAPSRLAATRTYKLDQAKARRALSVKGREQSPSRRRP
jgi:hypothetical protein